jgi:hypothetical protein
MPMRTRLPIALLLLSVLLMAQPIHGSTARIREEMDEMIWRTEIAGAVTLIATRERITHLQAVGFPALVPAQFNPILYFGLAPGTAIMMLREPKRSIHDPVGKYIPALGRGHGARSIARTLADLIPAYG